MWLGAKAKSMRTRPSPRKEVQSQAREAPPPKTRLSLSLSLSLSSFMNPALSLLLLEALSLPLACGAPLSLQMWPKKVTKLGQVALATSSPNLRPLTLAFQLFQPLSQ